MESRRGRPFSALWRSVRSTHLLDALGTDGGHARGSSEVARMGEWVDGGERATVLGAWSNYLEHKH